MEHHLEIKQKLDNLLEFIKENSAYNKALQKKYALGTICAQSSKFDKVIALLYDTVNTQSQPKINLLATFFQKAYANHHAFNSFHDFVKFLKTDYIKERDKPFESLFNGLKNQAGWGDKTSALFVKNIINYHRENGWETLKIWDDVPDLDEKVYLPVDTVIIAIFNKLDPTKKWGFATINNELRNNYSKEELILFDDLWFWGFITQKGTKDREFVWNEEKYWMIKESLKDKKEILKIKNKAEEFLAILNGNCTG